MTADCFSKIAAFDPASTSLAKKFLTPSVFDALSSLKTNSGVTLKKIITSGIQNADSSIGLYAGDTQSYDTFSLLFDPVIQEYHQFPIGTVHQSDWSSLDLPCLDPDQRYILSTRIRVARSLKEFAFPCHMDLTQRRALEKKVLDAFTRLKEPLAGQYVSFEHDDPALIEKLQGQGLVFKRGDRFQEAAGINTDFPKSRGVFYSKDRCFRVWVNEEDHLRIMSMAPSSDLTMVYNRLQKGLESLEKSLSYARSTTYGFLNTCPTNIGTAMRAGVHIRLKNLEKKPDLLHEIARTHHLQIRGTGGEKTRVDDAVFDISNRRRLGITEAQIIQQLHSGIKAILEVEMKIN